MNLAKNQVARLTYYGVALFETEIIYGTLKGVFGSVEEEQRPIEDSSYVSMINIEFPIPYDEIFFQTLTMERWFKIKALIKEMKRRRGRKGIKVFLCFCGISTCSKCRLIFSLLNKNSRSFEMGLEKIEYLVDIIPPQILQMPRNIEEVEYSYDELSFKWLPLIAKSYSSLERYRFIDNQWRIL